jgi:hypothetical protein
MSATANKTQPGIKPEAKKLIRDLPDAATWDDLMYQIFVRQKIEKGLEDVRAGRTHSHQSIRREFGLAS